MRKVFLVWVSSKFRGMMWLVDPDSIQLATRMPNSGLYAKRRGDGR